MDFIKTGSSALKNIFGISCRSYSISKGHASDKIAGGILRIDNSPVNLITYRRAELSQESFITKQILARYDINENTVAVRIQEDKFTDLKKKTIQGHKDTVAKVRDWYNPFQSHLGIPMGKLKLSSDVANEECRNAINVMLMEKDDFKNQVLNQNTQQSKYGGNQNKSWVVAPLKDFLDKGAKIYPDESSSLRLGHPVIITLPETTKVNVSIYPVHKK